MMEIIGRTYDDLMSDPECHQYRTNLNEADTTPENYNQDDFEQRIYREDWILIGYLTYRDVKRKFIVTTDNLHALIEEYGADSIITNELEIISGEEWLKFRWTEERE